MLQEISRKKFNARLARNTQFFKTHFGQSLLNTHGYYSEIFKNFHKKIKIDDTKFKKKEKSHQYKLFASNLNIDDLCFEKGYFANEGLSYT